MFPALRRWRPATADPSLERDDDVRYTVRHRQTLRVDAFAVRGSVDADADELDVVVVDSADG